MTPIDFAPYLAAVENVLEDLHDYEDLREVRRRFKAEPVLLIRLLNDMGIVGAGEEHPSPPEHCNLCAVPLAEGRFFVDGMTGRKTESTVEISPDFGLWSDMCLTCYEREGQGIGYGIGQLYRAFDVGDGSVTWRLIAGGHPSGELDPFA